MIALAENEQLLRCQKEAVMAFKKITSTEEKKGSNKESKSKVKNVSLNLIFFSPKFFWVMSCFKSN